MVPTALFGGGSDAATSTKDRIVKGTKVFGEELEVGRSHFKLDSVEVEFLPTTRASGVAMFIASAICDHAYEATRLTLMEVLNVGPAFVFVRRDCVERRLRRRLLDVAQFPSLSTEFRFTFNVSIPARSANGVQAQYRAEHVSEALKKEFPKVIVQKLKEIMNVDSSMTWTHSTWRTSKSRPRGSRCTSWQPPPPGQLPPNRVKTAAAAYHTVASCSARLPS